MSGSHLTLSCSGCPSRLHAANIFPPTLNTDTSSPNGNSSLAPGSPRHRVLSSCLSMVPARLSRTSLDGERGPEPVQGSVAIAVGRPGLQADGAVVAHRVQGGGD